MFADYAADVVAKHEAAQSEWVNTKPAHGGDVPEWVESSLDESESTLYKKHLSSEAKSYLKGGKKPADEESQSKKPSIQVNELELFRSDYDSDRLNAQGREEPKSKDSSAF